MILICGFGEVGKIVARRLQNARELYHIIDIDERTFENAEIPRENYTVGDATSEDILLDAGLGDASSLIACTGSDSTNAFITMTTTDINPDIVVLAKVNSKESVDRLYKAGADFTAPPGVESRTICSQGGFPALSGGCEGSMTEWFLEGRVPEEATRMKPPISAIRRLLQTIKGAIHEP